jgi:hypothetical protein
MFTVTFRQAAKLFLLGFLLTFSAGAILAQTTSFTY